MVALFLARQFMNQLKHLINIYTHNKTLNTVIFIVYTVLITSLSLKPHIDLGEVPYNDKIAHIISYGIFTLLGWRITQKAPTFTIVSVGIFIYSGLIEVAQSFTGRDMSALDLLANAIGITVTYFIIRQQSLPTTS